MEKFTKNKKKILILSLILNLAILFFFKYFNFFNDTIIILSKHYNFNWNIKNTSFLLPVGISFYTFQALSYSLDVYNGSIKAEKHFGKYALFVSFFPQLVAGPIEKSKNLLPQLNRVNNFDFKRCVEGFILIIFGIFKKIVIADRLSILVNNYIQ